MCLAFYCQFPVCKKVFLYFHEVRGTSALYNFPTYQWSQNNNTMAPVWSLGTVASLYLGVIRLYHRVIFGSIIWARFHKPPFEKSCAIPAARLDQKQWMYLVTTCHKSDLMRSKSAMESWSIWIERSTAFCGVLFWLRRTGMKLYTSPLS